MNNYDLAIAWKWKYDRDFVDLIESVFHANDLSTYVIANYNVTETADALQRGDLAFTAMLDRASDEDEAFQRIADFLTESNTYIINNYEATEAAIDKSVLHPKLKDAGIALPYTMVLPPYEKQPEIRLTQRQFDSLGKPFVIKPAYYSGGGEGVVLDAETLEDIQNARKIMYDDCYLLQRKVFPSEYKGKRAWFRVFWSFGNMIPTFWDDQTHLYEKVSDEDYKKLKLYRIKRTMEKLAEISEMDYFSSEFVLTDENKFLLIDYVNDQCDMRLKSQHTDGVPNDIVETFVHHMMEFVMSIRHDKENC